MSGWAETTKQRDRSVVPRTVRVRWVGGIALALTIGCQEPSVDEPGSKSATADVMEADRVFAQAVADAGLDAWVAAFADDGAMIPAAGPVARGHEAIRETMAPAFSAPDFTVVWEPAGGAVARAGDLAYTFGDYETKSGSRLLARGRYVTGWKRGEDGVWKVLADIGNRQPRESSEDG